MNSQFQESLKYETGLTGAVVDPRRIFVLVCPLSYTNVRVSHRIRNSLFALDLAFRRSSSA